MIDMPIIRPKFPWREGNAVTLLIDGDRFFPRMLEAITAARRSVLVEMYLIESGMVVSRFIDAFRQAAQRGVHVKLLLDGYGSLGLSRYDRQLLQNDNLKVAYYNRLRLGKLFNNMARDHRKLLVVDDELAFVGGAGLTDEFAQQGNSALPWRETMIEIRGPVVADWQALFSRVWGSTTGETMAKISRIPAERQDGVSGCVTIASGLRAQGIMRALVARVHKAERIVWLATAYFIPSWKLRSALRSAARKGIDVRLLLPGPETDHPAVRQAGRRYYAALLRAGVRIFEYQPRVLHAKTLVCDQWVTIGSCNFDRWNLRWNLEANQSVESARFAAEVISMFKKDFVECSEITLDRWIHRPLYLRMWEHLWGRVEVFLSRLGSGRRGR